MAKFEKTIQGDFTEWLKRIETGIVEGSMSASLEEAFLDKLRELL